MELTIPRNVELELLLKSSTAANTMPQRFSVLVRKLSALHSVSQDEQAALLAQVGDVRRYAKGDDIVADGSAPPHCTVMLDGLACRYKTLPDGGRQILQFQLPGD